MLLSDWNYCFDHSGTWCMLPLYWLCSSQTCTSLSFIAQIQGLNLRTHGLASFSCSKSSHLPLLRATTILSQCFKSGPSCLQMGTRNQGRPYKREFIWAGPWETGRVSPGRGEGKNFPERGNTMKSEESLSAAIGVKWTTQDLLPSVVLKLQWILDLAGVLAKMRIPGPYFRPTKNQCFGNGRLENLRYLSTYLDHLDAGGCWPYFWKHWFSDSTY